MKQYILDTNLFRYKTDPNPDQALKAATEDIWEQMSIEVQSKKAVIIIPAEVVRELGYQSFSMRERQVKKLESLKKLCVEIEPEYYNLDVEFCLRKLTGYTRAKFGEKLPRMDRLEASDARILYTAYEEEGILVTANTKDFILYALLAEQPEEVIYDIKTKQFVSISKEVYNEIHADEEFKELLQKFYDTKALAEEESQ